MPHTISQLNSLSLEPFIQLVGPVFEQSPWIAQAAWPKRPFASAAALHGALCEIVRESDDERKLALIRAHPDLVGRAALAGTLTPESASEQASAGLGALTPEEISAFQKANAAYREKFGFPFLICARLNKKETILNGFRVRLNNSRECEIETALEEIFKIARLRLQDTIRVSV